MSTLLPNSLFVILGLYFWFLFHFIRLHGALERKLKKWEDKKADERGDKPYENHTWFFLYQEKITTVFSYCIPILTIIIMGIYYIFVVRQFNNPIYTLISNLTMQYTSPLHGAYYNILFFSCLGVLAATIVYVLCIRHKIIKLDLVNSHKQ